MEKKQLIKCIRTFLFLVLILSKTNVIISQQEDLDVLSDEGEKWIEWTDANYMLIHHLNDRALALLDERDKEISGLRTEEDWIKRQKKVMDLLMKTVGPFPDKTPLNARVTGIVTKVGFRIEKIIYESMPKFYVTACMFIPDGKVEKRPAIIHVSGHSFPGFRGGAYTYIYNLVRKGFIVFAIDPIAQGERIQYWNDDKKTSQIGISPTREHCYFGNQMYLLGISPIRYFVWDGIRAVDYLLTRKEVDSERIGIFGCSGGGTQTTFISALDERIKAAVPGCYITGFRRLLESIGAQDAEQNIYLGIKNGLDQADLLELRAPKPLLISSTTRDGFSIQGAVETYQEIKMSYNAFNKEENAGQIIDDAGHGFNKNIIGIYAFFQKIFELPGSSQEEDFDGFNPEDFQITQTGQLSTSIGGKFAFDINKKEAQKLINKISDSRKNTNEHLNNVLVKVKELSGFIEPEEEVKSIFRGRYQRDGYSVEKYALHGEGEYVIPLLLFVPKNEGKLPGVIYIHPKGKIANASVGGKIEELVKEGYLVAAPDVIGVGEIEDKSIERIEGLNYLSLMIGQSVVGIQAGDIIKIVNFLKSRPNVDQNKISAVAFDEMCPALLHAAALNKYISAVTLIGSLISYQTVVMNRFYNIEFLKYYVAGALTAYDLPDLMGCIAPRKITLVELKDQLKQPASKELIDQELSYPRSVYLHEKVPMNLNILPSTDDLYSVVSWCFGNK